MTVKIAPFGKTVIVLGLAVAASSYISIRWVELTWIGLAFAAFSAYFFRDPDIEVTEDPAVLLSPAQGTVLSAGAEGTDGSATIRIFLSVFNIHVQRAPSSGKVGLVAYHKGAFAVASAPEANRNERNEIRLDGPSGPVTVEQIAGFIARRIACYVREGEEVRQGQRIGIIYFGSQVAVRVPPGWAVQVRPGQKVELAATVLARKA